MRTTSDLTTLKDSVVSYFHRHVWIRPPADSTGVSIRIEKTFENRL